MLVDTHAHLNHQAFDKDREKIIKECLENDIWMINVGINLKTSKKAIEISEKYKKGVYAAIGIHPEEIDEEGFNYEEHKKIVRSKKVVAIGEIGLDYWQESGIKGRFEIFKERQREVFFKQLGLAQEFNLPVIIHCRLAHQDLGEILEKLNPKPRGVIHCFTGTWAEAKKYLEMGFWLGFNGIIFKKIKGIDFKDIITKTPLEKILIETDCPYLTPPGFIEKRNNPLGVKLVAKEISEIKNLSFERVAEITTESAKRLFGLK